MGGTSGSIGSSGGGGGNGLPAPKVQLYRPATSVQLFAASNSPSLGALKVSAKQHVKVTVPGLPQAVLADLAGYKPLIELMRYTRRHSPDAAAGGASPASSGGKTAGYVHPSNAPAPSGVGSFTHGGAHSGVNADVEALRVTEWDILAGNTAVDVTQGMLGFMVQRTIRYRDSGGALNTIAAMCASTGLSLFGRFGSRFPYAGVMTPGYFCFRISVIDKSDPRGKRVHGPSSQRIACANDVFPFVPAGLDGSGKAQATLHPLFVNDVLSFRLNTRTPG